MGSLTFSTFGKHHFEPHRGEGDLHDAAFDTFRRSAVLTDEQFYIDTSPTYRLSLYPNAALYDEYASKFPVIVAVGAAVLSIVIIAIAFSTFDFIVRKEFRAKQELLEAKRRFMRFGEW